jgi:hypothetical protein
MKAELIDYQNVYQNASLGMYGNKIYTTGMTSDPLHGFISVTAIEDSTISYAKTEVHFETYGDATVVNLEILAGMTLAVGVIKNLNVATGKVFANLITRP